MGNATDMESTSFLTEVSLFMERQSLDWNNYFVLIDILFAWVWSFMQVCMKAVGKRAATTALARVLGRMAENMWETGNLVWRMEKELKRLPTAGCVIRASGPGTSLFYLPKARRVLLVGRRQFLSN